MTYNTTVQYARVLELIKQGARINEKDEVLAPLIKHLYKLKLNLIYPRRLIIVKMENLLKL